jgi:hypothetical protein
MFKSILDGKAIAQLSKLWQSETLVNNVRADAVAAVNELYSVYGKKAPIVIVCQSPWQLVMTKTLLQNGGCSPELFTTPANDPFLPHESRWMWRDLWKNLNEQSDERTRSRFVLTKQQDFWSGTLNLVLAQTGLYGPWSWFSPSLHDSQKVLTTQLQKEIKSQDSLGLLGTIEKSYSQYFPFATRDSNYKEIVGRQIMDYAIGNQPAEIRASVLTNLMSPAIASMCKNFGEINFEVRPQQQRQIELGILSLASVNELIETRALIGFLPLYQLLVETERTLQISSDNKRKLQGLLKFFKVTPLTLMFDEICLVCEQPKICSYDAANRLHSETGPALAFSDEFKVFARHGVKVPRFLIEAPEQLTADKILQETNLEVRRIMLESFGMARFVTECGAKKIHEDQFGELYRKETRNIEPLVIVKVRNSTAEPDGSIRDYFIRVPPNMSTAKQAVAWTFNMSEADYSPDAES